MFAGVPCLPELTQGCALPTRADLMPPSLQNMKSHTDNHSAGYEVVCAALDTMTALAGHINDMKRRHEHAVRVQEIQSLLYGWEVSLRQTRCSCRSGGICQ